MDPPQIGDGANSFFFNTFDNAEFNDSQNYSENKSEDFNEGNIQHPYENLVMNGSEPKKPQFEDQEPAKAQKLKNDSHKQASNSSATTNKDKASPHNPPVKKSLDSFEPPKNISNTNQIEPKRNNKVPESYQAAARGYADEYRPESRDANNPRSIKSAHRGVSEPK